LIPFLCLRNIIIKFIIDNEMVRKWAPKIKVGYSAFNGAGNLAVPRLLRELGFTQTKVITKLQELDGTFPAFGWNEQPDPGGPLCRHKAIGTLRLHGYATMANPKHPGSTQEAAASYRR